MKIIWLVILFLLPACQSEQERADQQYRDSAQRESQRLRQGLRDRLAADSATRATTSAAPIQRPCTGRRPYKSWSTAELNVALVKYMGTDNPALVDLIEEGACRQ